MITIIEVDKKDRDIDNFKCNTYWDKDGAGNLYYTQY